MHFDEFKESYHTTTYVPHLVRVIIDYTNIFSFLKNFPTLFKDGAENEECPNPFRQLYGVQVERFLTKKGGRRSPCYGPFKGETLFGIFSGPFSWVNLEAQIYFINTTIM